MTVRRLAKICFIFLLVPLLTGFAQARLLDGLDCSECMVKLEAKSSCCAQTAAVDISVHCGDDDTGGGKSADSSCPHAELCQTDGSMVVALVSPSILKQLDYRPSTWSDSRFPALSFITKDQKTPLPPSSFPEERYLLLCSFLI